MVDTNSDPNLVDFPIPANDDATKSIELIVDVMIAAIKEGLEERKNDKDRMPDEDPKRVREGRRRCQDASKSCCKAAVAAGRGRPLHPPRLKSQKQREERRRRPSLRTNGLRRFKGPISYLTKSMSTTMAITAADVNKLRQMTGAGMMDCKKALTRGQWRLRCRHRPIAQEGPESGRQARRPRRQRRPGDRQDHRRRNPKVLVSVNCETDFVAKNSDFAAMAEAHRRRSPWKQG
jgi:hypothetical protein